MEEEQKQELYSLIVTDSNIRDRILKHQKSAQDFHSEIKLKNTTKLEQ